MIFLIASCGEKRELKEKYNDQLKGDIHSSYIELNNKSDYFKSKFLAVFEVGFVKDTVTLFKNNLPDTSIVLTTIESLGYAGFLELNRKYLDKYSIFISGYNDTIKITDNNSKYIYIQYFGPQNTDKKSRVLQTLYSNKERKYE
jgi:hypothetical protein